MSTDRTAVEGGPAIVMEWLREGLPLTLLLDLWDPRGLRADELLAEPPSLPRMRHAAAAHAVAM